MQFVSCTIQHLSRIAHISIRISALRLHIRSKLQILGAFRGPKKTLRKIINRNDLIAVTS